MSPRRPLQRVTDRTRPLLRGHLHQAAFFVSLPAGVALVAAARGASAVVASTVYAATMCLLFGASALYHRVDWSPGAKRVFQRIDHSMIYVFIAGSYTPFCILLLGGWAATLMLTAVWSGAIVGVVLRSCAVAPRLAGALYLVLGWLMVLGLPRLLTDLEPPTLALLFAGGLLYTVGAIMFWNRRPDPAPHVFGYHEVWHTFTVVAASLHYTAVWLVTRAG